MLIAFAASAFAERITVDTMAGPPRTAAPDPVKSFLVYAFLRLVECVSVATSGPRPCGGGYSECAPNRYLRYHNKYLRGPPPEVPPCLQRNFFTNTEGLGHGGTEIGDQELVSCIVQECSRHTAAATLPTGSG